MTPEEARARADDAKRLLEDPILKAAFEDTQEALINAVAIAKTPDESYKAAVALQTFRLIRDCISSHIETARVIEYNSKKTFVDRIFGR